MYFTDTEQYIMPTFVYTSIFFVGLEFTSTEEDFFCSWHGLLLDFKVITGCNEVAKVMFLQVSVCPQGGSGPGGVWSQEGVSGPRGVWSWGGVCSRDSLSTGEGVGIPAYTEATPPPRDSHCCGRYASYWNAFLFEIVFKSLFCQVFSFSNPLQISINPENESK